MTAVKFISNVGKKKKKLEINWYFFFFFSFFACYAALRCAVGLVCVVHVSNINLVVPRQKPHVGP